MQPRLGLLGDCARAALGGSHGGNRRQDHTRGARTATFTRGHVSGWQLGVFHRGQIRTAEDREIVVVPSQGGRLAVSVPCRGSFDDKPRWSDDGRLLYFCFRSRRAYNVWAVRFDPRVGKPLGEPFPVTRFDGPGEMIESVTQSAEFGVAAGRLFLPLVTPTGGIWMLEGIASAPAGRALGWRLSIVLAAVAIALIALTKGLTREDRDGPSRNERGQALPSRHAVLAGRTHDDPLC